MDKVHTKNLQVNTVRDACVERYYGTHVAVELERHLGVFHTNHRVVELHDISMFRTNTRGQHAHLVALSLSWRHGGILCVGEWWESREGRGTDAGSIYTCEVEGSPREHVKFRSRSDSMTRDTDDIRLASAYLLLAGRHVALFSNFSPAFGVFLRI